MKLNYYIAIASLLLLVSCTNFEKRIREKYSDKVGSLKELLPEINSSKENQELDNQQPFDEYDLSDEQHLSDYNSGYLQQPSSSNNLWLIGEWKVRTKEHEVILITFIDNKNVVEMSSLGTQRGTYKVIGNKLSFNDLSFLNSTYEIDTTRGIIYPTNTLFFEKISNSTIQAADTTDPLQIIFNHEDDIMTYLNNTFKSTSSDVTLKRKGQNIYVGNVQLGGIEVLEFSAYRATIALGPYIFFVELDNHCMSNDEIGDYKLVYE